MREKELSKLTLQFLDLWCCPLNEIENKGRISGSGMEDHEVSLGLVVFEFPWK